MIKEFIKNEMIKIKKDPKDIYASSMRLYYKILENLKNMNETNKYTESELHNTASTCSDNIEVILTKFILYNKLQYFTEEELSDIIHQIIISNIKYLYKLFLK